MGCLRYGKIARQHFFIYPVGKRLLKEVLAIKPIFYMQRIENNGVIEGVYPLGHVKSLLFGNTLMSSPFCVYGGVVAKFS